jgi:hypothetical protein
VRELAAALLCSRGSKIRSNTYIEHKQSKFRRNDLSTVT